MCPVVECFGVHVNSSVSKDSIEKREKNVKEYLNWKNSIMLK